MVLATIEALAPHIDGFPESSVLGQARAAQGRQAAAALYGLRVIERLDGHVAGVDVQALLPTLRRQVAPRTATPKPSAEGPAQVHASPSDGATRGGGASGHPQTPAVAPTGAAPSRGTGDSARRQLHRLRWTPRPMVALRRTFGMVRRGVLLAGLLVAFAGVGVGGDWVTARWEVGLFDPTGLSAIVAVAAVVPTAYVVSALAEGRARRAMGTVLVLILLPAVPAVVLAAQAPAGGEWVCHRAWAVQGAGPVGCDTVVVPRPLWPFQGPAECSDVLRQAIGHPLPSASVVSSRPFGLSCAARADPDLLLGGHVLASMLDHPRAGGCYGVQSGRPAAVACDSDLVRLVVIATTSPGFVGCIPDGHGELCGILHPEVGMLTYRRG